MSRLTLKQEDLNRLAGKECNLVIMTEIYRDDNNGNAIESLGFYEDEKVAKGLMPMLQDPISLKTRQVLVLADGKNRFYAIREIEVINVTNKEAAIAVARHNLKTKFTLTTETAELIGLA